MSTVVTNPDTAWQAGRLSSAAGPRRILFGRMYEDVEIERAAFKGKGRVFCIASAGSSAIALSRDHDVVACDINPVQLAYAERRVHGGPAEVGEADRAMAFARHFMPLIGWRSGLMREFLSLSDTSEQMAFWRQHLDTKRFRAGFDLLLSRPTLRLAYSPQFLAFLPPGFGEIVRKRLERGFSLHPNATNPHIRALFLGEVAEPEKADPARVQFVLGDAASYLESCEPGSFDAFTLSNILDGAQPSYGARLSGAVRRAASKDAVLVMRSFGEPPADLKENLAGADRAMLWGVVDVRPAASF